MPKENRPPVINVPTLLNQLYEPLIRAAEVEATFHDLQKFS
jgi:hypothetical protein